MPFHKPTKVGHFLTDLASWKGNNVLVHDVWSDTITNSMRIQSAFFEISFVNKLGNIEDSSHQITSQCFNQIISNLSSFQTKKFVLYGAQKDFFNANHAYTSRPLINSAVSNLFGSE